MYHEGKHSHSALGCLALVNGRASRILFFFSQANLERECSSYIHVRQFLINIIKNSLSIHSLFLAKKVANFTHHSVRKTAAIWSGEEIFPRSLNMCLVIWGIFEAFMPKLNHWTLL